MATTSAVNHYENRSRNRKEAANLPEGECVIPPAIPTSVLPNLMFKRDMEGERSIRSYVEWQAQDEKVIHAERVATEFVLGSKLEAWDVITDKRRWWVITSPTNLYSQELFPSLDYTISFHVGLMARMMSEHDPGVEPLEQSLLSAAWRRWEQAAGTLDEAEEAEDFQAVGMRCRECFVAMVKEIANPDVVPTERDAPKRSDAAGWCDLIADHVASGASAEHVRRYLKSISKAGWQLVNWLTHASGATRADAILAVELTQHVLSIFGTAVLRRNLGIPDRCSSCGSYKIGIWAQAEEDKDYDLVLRCQSCGLTYSSPTDGRDCELD